MRTTRQLSVTLPHEMADMVRAKVDAGDYASESEVVREGLRALVARDRALAAWLSQSVGPAYDRHMADPSRTVDIDEVRARLSQPGQQ